MSPSLKRNEYCWGMVGVNGAKTRAHVISLGGSLQYKRFVTAEKRDSMFGWSSHEQQKASRKSRYEAR